MDHEKWLEQHDQMIADHELRFNRDMALLQASQAKTEQTLRRAIRLNLGATDGIAVVQGDRIARYFVDGSANGRYAMAQHSGVADN